MQNILQVKQLKRYDKDGIDYLKDSSWLNKYILAKGVASETSANTYRSRLNQFGFFILKKYSRNDKLS
jgi:hypothetical protein